MLGEIVTCILEKSFCLVLGHDTSNDDHACSSHALLDRVGHGSSFDVSELCNGDDLQSDSGQACLTVIVPKRQAYLVSLGGHFFGPDLELLHQVIPGFLDLLFKAGGQVSLEIHESVGQRDGLSSGESGKNGTDVTLLLLASHLRSRSFGGDGANLPMGG